MLSIHFHRIVVFVLSISLYHHSLNNILRGLIVFLILYLFMIYVFSQKKKDVTIILLILKLLKKMIFLMKNGNLAPRKAYERGTFWGAFNFFTII